MRMKAAVAVVLVLLLSAGQTLAAITTVNTPWAPIGGSGTGEKNLTSDPNGLLGVTFAASAPGSILAHFYGSWQRVDDSLDQVWWNPDGVAKAEAKYAGYAQAVWYDGLGGGAGATTDLQIFTAAMNSSNGLIDPGAAVVLPSYPVGHGPSDPHGEFFVLTDITSGGTWSSWQSRNTDGNKDHMVTFKILTDSLGGRLIDTFVVGFEDQSMGDRDYNDVVVELTGVRTYDLQLGDPTVPEPASLIVWSLLGAAGAAAALRSRKRRGWSDENRQGIYDVINRA
jgi:hypothetical protein